MPFLILLLFLAFPLLEITLLIRLGGAIGVWATLGLIVGTAVLGTLALRRQGLVVLRRASQAMREGRAPVEPVIEGALMGLGGFLLILPGVITDVLGALLLLPPVRRLLASVLGRSFTQAAGPGQAEARWPGEERASNPDSQRPAGGAAGPIVIEGEFERLDERPMTGGSPSPPPGAEARKDES